MDDEPLSKEAVIEPGQLVKILQKGLLYLAVEAHVNSVSEKGKIFGRRVSTLD